MWKLSHIANIFLGVAVYLLSKQPDSGQDNVAIDNLLRTPSGHLVSETPHDERLTKSRCLQLIDQVYLDGDYTATVRFAEYHPAGENFTGDTLVDWYNIPQFHLPAFCRASVDVKSSPETTINFEVWLPPASIWNRRFLATGNGVWAGGVNYPDVVKGLRHGFATMSTDTGHQSSQFDGSWLAHKEKQTDFGHRGMHLSTIFAKHLVKDHYSHLPKSQTYSYYMGCSTGGRQGLAEAQQYPDDFDGILVGAPAHWQSHLHAWEIFVGQPQFSTGSRDSFLPLELLSVVHAEALRQCDHLDGVVDNLISDPQNCKFDTSRLLCRKGKEGGCLTAPQVEYLNRIYQGWKLEDGTLIFNGFLPGSEMQGLAHLMVGQEAGSFGADYYKYAIFNDSTWDSQSLSYADVLRAEELDPGLNDQNSPDLSGFRRRGGKLLHYHGLQDAFVSPENSPRYYKSVASFFSPSTSSTPFTTVNPSSGINDFYRLFMIPGLAHCWEGDGAWVLDSPNQGPSAPPGAPANQSALLSLVAWVEHDKAPEVLVGTRWKEGSELEGVEYTRPSCQYPDVPRWVGDAGEWRCPERSTYSTIGRWWVEEGWRKGFRGTQFQFGRLLKQGRRAVKG